jgi:hypothetical protein
VIWLLYNFLLIFQFPGLYPVEWLKTKKGKKKDDPEVGDAASLPAKLAYVAMFLELVEKAEPVDEFKAIFFY